MTKFTKKKPCNSCPYRKDTSLQIWHREEFERLLENEKDYIGKVYGCHKKDGCACTGWLMLQDKNYFPSMALRLELTFQGIDRTYLDALNSPSPLYESVEEMCAANYPDLLSNSDKQKSPLR